jgi:hypothetical protein
MGLDAFVMSRAKRCAIANGAALLALAVSLPTLVPATAHAQEIAVEGPLAGAPAVIGLRDYRRMRLQIQLQASITLEDEYSRAIIGGGQLMFHPVDWLGIGIWGGYGLIPIDVDLTDQVAEKGQTNEVNILSLPTAANFAEQIGQIQWVAAPQVAFIPLRGKLGIFEKLFVDTDFYVAGGVAFVGLEERAPVTSAQFDNCRRMGESSGISGSLRAEIDCFAETQTLRETRVAIAPTFAVGLSLYLSDFVAMTMEWRGLPFAWNTSGTDESGDAAGDFPDDVINEKDRLNHFNHMFTLGLAFYLPTEPHRAHMDDEDNDD